MDILRGSIFLYFWITTEKWDTVIDERNKHRERREYENKPTHEYNSSQHNIENHNGRLSVQSSSYEAVKSLHISVYYTSFLVTPRFWGPLIQRTSIYITVYSLSLTDHSPPSLFFYSPCSDLYSELCAPILYGII